MTDRAPAANPSEPLGRRLGLVALALMAVSGVLFLEDLGGGALNRVLLYLPGIDKVLHVGQSAIVLVVTRLLLRRIAPALRYPTLVAATLTASLAGIDEIQQSYTAERTVEYADISASCCGVAIAAGFLHRRRSTAATALMVAGVLAGGMVYVQSYRETRDVKLALRLEGQGRFGEARHAYRRAIAAGHTSAAIYNGAAWVEIESGEGEPATAVDFAERSLALEPGNPDTLDTYGWALYHAGRVDDAYARLMEAFATKPSIYCIHYHLAIVLLKQGRVTDALHHLRQQIALQAGTREAARARELLARDADLQRAAQISP